ncbi:MAG TPA: hypothetical protein VMW12_05075 [Candidatus Dormibacteraeota bacterium]|nr:hypothetical protein [Candidatus Dormibacteraeota bacterium]
MSAVAALWLVGLLLAAPALRTSDRYTLADRLRDALVLGVAIPATLGLLAVLYAATCWCLLIAALIVAYLRERARGPSAPTSEAPPYLIIAVLALLAWPPLMRPPLDGDTLAYHLPNAASWAHAHSLWTTQTRYWWYPFGSEAFASGIYTTSGAFAVGWAGLLAMALLAFRIATWCVERIGTSPLLAQTIACATIAAWPLAVQAGSLQNDVWLAAFLLELLWAKDRPFESRSSSAIAALIKPYGWLLALLAFPASRARFIPILGVLGIVLARIVILNPHADITIAQSSIATAAQQTILAHGIGALAELLRVFVSDAPFAALAVFAALSAPFWSAKDRWLGAYAWVTVIVFLALPFSYENQVPQLASGLALRLAIPAIAIGALVLARIGKRFPAAAVAVTLAATIAGVATILATYWNDAPTRSALGVAAIAVGTFALAGALRRAWLVPVALACAIGIGAALAAVHPADYYADATTLGGARSNVFAWLIAERPARVATWGLRSGIVNVLSPSTSVYDVSDALACVEAGRDRALLLAFADRDSGAIFDVPRRKAAFACGAPLYEDALAVVAQPR